MRKTIGIRAVLQPIMRLAFSIEKIADRTLRAKVNLTFAMFRMLLVIAKHPQANQRDIAAFWGVAEASVSRQIESLRRRKFIARVPIPGNRRSHAFVLTPSGARLIGRGVAAIDAELEAAFRSLPPTARRRLGAELQRLVASFDAAFGCAGRKMKAVKTG